MTSSTLGSAAVKLPQALRLDCSPVDTLSPESSSGSRSALALQGRNERHEID